MIPKLPILLFMAVALAGCTAPLGEAALTIHVHNERPAPTTVLVFFNGEEGHRVQVDPATSNFVIAGPDSLTLPRGPTRISVLVGDNETSEPLDVIFYRDMHLVVSIHSELEVYLRERAPQWM